MEEICRYLNKAMDPMQFMCQVMMKLKNNQLKQKELNYINWNDLLMNVIMELFAFTFQNMNSFQSSFTEIQLYNRNIYRM